MPPRPRPALAPKSRPISAIFIGSTSSTPPHLPALPEPPSPSSSNSGLPSPPATNSTGSGSVDDDSKASIRRLSPRPLSTDMSNGYDKPYNNSRIHMHSPDDEDDQNDPEHDEDYTAKLPDGRRHSMKTAPDDNVSALQRVKSLTQRNRMVLDKLSSISRLSSPAPSQSSRSPFSPPSAPSPSSSSGSSKVSSSSHTRPQSSSHTPAVTRRQDTALSGSETERESRRSSMHSYSSSDDLSATPPTNLPSPPIRQRRISAPSSPDNPFRSMRDRDRGPSPGPSRPLRKRVSMTMSVSGNYSRQERDTEDVTTAALAAVASSRQSSGSGKRSRQPLPKEFRERDKRSLDGNDGEPATPHRHRGTTSGPTSPQSPRLNALTSSDPPRPSRITRPGDARYSTVRELTRKHQTRWLSEDLSAHMEDEDPISRSADGDHGRRQNHRGGSSDNALGGVLSGRSVVGEGLRAAGLTRRKDNSEDVFVSDRVGQAIPPRRTKSSGTASAENDFSNGFGNGFGSGIGRIRSTEGASYRMSEPRTPAMSSRRQEDRSAYTGPFARPGTSMAALHHESNERLPPRTAPPAMRTYRSAQPLQDRTARSRSRHADRSHVRSPSLEHTQNSIAYSSRAGTVLPTMTGQSTGRDTNAEHKRLMLEALSVFESHLSRLPPMGQTTTTTIPELFQNAQHVVHTLDRLNGMLKSDTNRALEQQIEAEVGDHSGGIELVELWKDICADSRESLRVSDEVVRNVTALLLGVGKVFREIASFSASQHPRSASVNDEASWRLGQDDTGRTPEGRRSRQTRHSWDLVTRDPERLTRPPSYEQNVGHRPSSSLNLYRASGPSSSEGRSVDDVVQQTPQTSRNYSPALASVSATHRLFTPREQREQRSTPDTFNRPVPRVSQESQAMQHGYEPSPTPLSRSSQPTYVDRTRALPPLSIPPSLSSIPSESFLSRGQPVLSERFNRRKISSNSNITVRPESTTTTFHPTIKPPNTTTAVTTHTVSISPIDQSYLPLQRQDSAGSSRTNGATFSRPSAVSVSTLNGLQQKQQLYAGRNHSTTEIPSSANQSALTPTSAISPRSGSETERDIRRTMSTRGKFLYDDGSGVNGGTENAAKGGEIRSLSSASRKERRRTITEIFSQR